MLEKKKKKTKAGSLTRLIKLNKPIIRLQEKKEDTVGNVIQLLVTMPNGTATLKFHFTVLIVRKTHLLYDAASYSNANSPLIWLSYSRLQLLFTLKEADIFCLLGILH